jgi:hypothetical protein
LWEAREAGNFSPLDPHIMSSSIQNVINARRKRRRESYISMVIDGPATSKTIFLCITKILIFKRWGMTRL